MEKFPSKAKCVIIGAGIVGNSIVHHLSKLGWKDLVMIDTGPLPNPGGSTGHASNFIYPVDHGKIMTEITLDSMRQYKELGVFRECGGLELARTEARMDELKRRVASAKCWGIEAEMVTPARARELFPWLEEDLILGACWFPTVGVVDSLRAGTLMRESAQQSGALSVFPNTEVLDMAVEEGRIKSVKTSRGDIEADYVVIACGVWSPKLARMAGATIPLIPMVHQMIDVGPITAFEATESEIEYPIIRDMCALMYERQAGRNIEVGSYAHRPIVHRPDDIPTIEESKLSPTELPFTLDDFEPQLEDAMELLPEMLGGDDSEIQYSINGLISMTPDGMPVLGETEEVKGLWSAAAIWIKEGPAAGRMLAEWMVNGVSEIDSHELDISRFYPYARTENYAINRCSEAFNKMYGIVHPAEQWENGRNMRTTPFYERQKDLGAVFFQAAGWERPHWYESNKPLLEKYEGQLMPRDNEWDARWWSPIINAEHLALRESGALCDLSAFAQFEIKGSNVVSYAQKMALAEMDVNIGKAVYTTLLDHKGGMKSDLTMIRTAHDTYRIITGGADGNRDKKWFTDHLPGDGSVQFADLTSGVSTIGIWGPNARKCLQSICSNDLSNEAFPFASAQMLDIDELPVWALRISYVGEMGWELHFPTECGRYLWDILAETGKSFGIIPCGIGVYGTTGRIEKSYRLYGAELESSFSPVECGLARRNVKDADFIGKDAYLLEREAEPSATLCSLTVDYHRSKNGQQRYMLGGEPVLTADGKEIKDRKGRRSYVTSAGNAPSLGKHVLMAYLPPEYAEVGKQLKVEYFCEQYPVTVGVVGSTALFDPKNEKMR